MGLLPGQGVSSIKAESGGTPERGDLELTGGTGMAAVSDSSGVFTIALSTPVSVADGGTGQTTYTDGQLLIGNTTGNTLAKATLSATSNQTSITNGHGTITIGTVQDIGTGSTPTFSTLTLTSATNQLILSGPTRTATLSAVQPATSSRTYTFPDAGANANVVMDAGNYTIGGTWTLNNDTTLASSKAIKFTDNTTNTVTMKATNSTTSWTLSLPTTAGSNTNVLQTDGSGNTSWVAAGGGPVATAALTGKSSGSTINDTTIYTTPNDGVTHTYRVTIVGAATAAASTTSVNMVPKLTWTDPLSNVYTDQPSTTQWFALAVGASTSFVGKWRVSTSAAACTPAGGQWMIKCKANTAIQYNIAPDAGSGDGTYAVDIIVEKLV